VLVKKMFRVPDMATEFAVSALWRLRRAADVGAAAFGSAIYNAGKARRDHCSDRVGFVRPWWPFGHREVEANGSMTPGWQDARRRRWPWTMLLVYPLFYSKSFYKLVAGILSSVYIFVSDYFQMRQKKPYYFLLIKKRVVRFIFKLAIEHDRHQGAHSFKQKLHTHTHTPQ
jgi:hypothetical protein